MPASRAPRCVFGSFSLPFRSLFAHFSVFALTLRSHSARLFAHFSLASTHFYLHVSQAARNEWADLVDAATIPPPNPKPAWTHINDRRKHLAHVPPTVDPTAHAAKQAAARARKYSSILWAVQNFGADLTDSCVQLLEYNRCDPKARCDKYRGLPVADVRAARH